MKIAIASLILLLFLSMAGCNANVGAVPKPILVDSAWIKTGTTGTNTAAFMVIKNTSAQEDKLIKAECDVSGKVSLMNVKMANMKMEMVNVDSIAVPANGQVELKSGSYHVMFMGLNKDLNEGGTIHLTLTFEKAGAVQLDVPVKKGS